jgi:hypothetical protein
MHKRGDLLLVPFPFTDLFSNKAPAGSGPDLAGQLRRFHRSADDIAPSDPLARNDASDTSSLGDIGVAEIATFEQQARAMYLGAGAGKTIAEIQTGPALAAFAVALEPDGLGTGLCPPNRSDENWRANFPSCRPAGC